MLGFLILVMFTQFVGNGLLTISGLNFYLQNPPLGVRLNQRVSLVNKLPWLISTHAPFLNGTLS